MAADRRRTRPCRIRPIVPGIGVGSRDAKARVARASAKATGAAADRGLGRLVLICTKVEREQYGLNTSHAAVGAIAESWRRCESGRRHIVGVFDASTSPPKERYAVPNDNVLKLIQPGAFDDQLTDVLRNGARALLAQAVEAEVADFLGKHADLQTEDGRRRVVRHGHLPEREVMTGIGPVAVRQPRVRDRKAAAGAPGRIRFTPSILPPYMRRSKSIETLLPILYLKGISTGDFSEALAALLGEDAAGLSASAIGRLRDGWQDDHAAWQKRDLSARRYVYVWADGIHRASLQIAGPSRTPIPTHRGQRSGDRGQFLTVVQA